MGFSRDAVVKKICLPTQEMQEMWLWSLDREDPLEKEMTAHFSILPWEIPQGILVGYRPVDHKSVRYDFANKEHLQIEMW